VNLAARLQAAGEAGGVLASESTARLASRHFTIEELPPLTVKGIAQPVRAFRVTGERTRRVRFDAAVERGLTPFVGRESALDFLANCFARVEAGRGQAVSIAGDAGIGKSRLVYEFRRRLANVDCRYLRGGCLPHGEASPFRLIVDLLRSNFAIEEAEPEAQQIEKLERAIAGLDPELAWTLPYVKLLLALPSPELDAQGLDQAQRKIRTLEALKALLFGTAEGRPLVLLVEDLQWIDKSSLEALRALVDALADHRVLLVATHRGGYTPPWQDRSVHQRLALAPLSPTETARMVDALVPSASDRAVVIARGEGNPFFLEELAAYLRVARDEGAAAVIARGVPDTIQDLLMARIDRLAEPVKRTLQCASVLGREFGLATLEALAPGENVREHVAELVDREMLHETQLHPELRLSFTQSLIRDVAYGGLPMKSRAELHARAAAATEAAYAGRLEEVLADLARHYAQTTDHEKAIHYALRAGDRAAALFAFEDAIEVYRDGLRLAEADASLAPRRVELLDRMGDAALAQGEIEESLGYWRDALAAQTVEVDRKLVPELHRKRGVGEWAAGRTDRALAELDAGLAALGEERESLAAARLYQELGRFHFRLGDDEAARRYAERALALGEQLGAPDVVSHAYNTLGVVRARSGDLSGGAAMVTRSLEAALAHDLAALACRAYTNLAVLFVTLDHARSAAYCREGLALAQRIGDQLQQSWLHCAMAGGHCTLSGDYDEGVKSAEAAIELDRRLGQRNHLPIPIIILAQIYQCRGDQARSRERYLEALALAEPIGEPQLLFPCYDGLATLAVEDGDEASADEWLAKSRAVQESAGWTSDSFFVLPFLC
jgi:adenylate cyclase